MHNQDQEKNSTLFQIFMLTVPAAAAMLDREMRYIAVTKRWLEVFDLNGENVIGRSHYDLFPQENDYWKTVYNRCMAGEQESRETESIRRDDGSVQWLRWKIVPWYDDHGRVGGIIISVEDISERKRDADAVRWSEARFRKLFEFAPDGIVIVNGRHEIMMVNDRIMQMTGYGREELTRRPIEMLVPEEYAGRHVAWRSQYESGLRQDAHKRGQSSEVHCRRRDGTIFPADISISPFVTGEEMMVLTVVRDITEHRKAESSQRLAAAVFDNTTEGIVVTDADVKVQSVNQAFTQITGYTLAEIAGKNPRILKAGLQDAGFYASMWETISKTGGWKGRFWNRRKTGEVYPQETSINEIRTSRGEVLQYCAVFRDITEQMKLEETLRRLSTTDSLTGLANRRAFDETIDLEWRRALRTGTVLSLIIADIDNFKKLNDTYGHPTGDEGLRKIGSVLKKAGRRAGNLAARYGGDEFALLLPSMNGSEARKTAEEVRAAVKAIRIAHEKSDLEVPVTLSMGIAAVVPNRNASVEGLIAMADQALYRAKQAGRNRVESAA